MMQIKVIKWVVFMIIILLIKNGICMDKPILMISANEIEIVDDGQWSKIEEIDGKKVRKALKGKIALFNLQNWWGNSNRPKEGEFFVIEISYLDTTSAPVIISSFGNCARLKGLSELHRIGGNNDKKWKTGIIPVSWDYLYSGKGNPAREGKQQFGILVDKNDESMPISKIIMRKCVLPDDEIRYNIETRLLINNAQKKYLSSVVEPEKMVANIPDDWKSKECIPYVQNYLKPILPSTMPNKSLIGVPVKLCLALNEIECAQFGVYANNKDLKDVLFNITPLKDNSGNILSADVKIFTEEYALVRENSGSFILDAQRIWPMYKVDVSKGKSQGFWINVETNEKLSKPGKYTGEINIEASNINEKVKIPVEVQVTSVKLLTIDEAELRMGCCVNGLVPFHNIDYAAKNNINGSDLWVFSARPDMSKENGKLKLDFTLIDEWMREAKKRGWKKITYFLGGNPYGFPETMTLEKMLFITMQDEGDRKSKTEKFIKLASSEKNRNNVMEEIREVYGQWIREVTEHAKANDWPELILTPFDEPAKYTAEPNSKEMSEYSKDVIGAGPWIKPHFEDSCDLIRKYKEPGTLIFGEIHHSYGIVFLPKIDMLCTNAIHEDPLLGEKVRKANKHFWQYTGVNSKSAPSRMRFSFGFFFGAYNSRGSLLWAYNWGTRFNTTEEYNWMICGDTPFSTIPTLSYEGLREALDDRRYIETLRKTGKDKKKEKEVETFLEKIFKEAKEVRTSGGRDTVNDFWVETKEQTKLDEWRHMISDKIIELSY